MELILWRWSIAVQIVSLLLITAFFTALRRSTSHPALAAWVRGWYFNLLSLVIALLFWVLLTNDTTRPFAFFLFVAPKNLAILYLVQGAWRLRNPASAFITRGHLIVAGVLLPLLGARLYTDIPALGLGQQLFVALMLLPTAVALARTRDRALGWMAMGFFARGGLCLFESFVYATQLVPEDALSEVWRSRASTFLSVHSAFDSGTEWLLALGFVLALSLRTQRELQGTIQGLSETQDGLKHLVEYDALTALLNRRALTDVLRSIRNQGATLLFFDLDGFKKVNDELGHEGGDRLLKHFADALKESFRPDDAYVRYGGDEFLVIARGLSRDLAEERIRGLRERLAAAPVDGGAVLRFSVGIAELPPGGEPEDALKQADGLMYAAKAAR